MFFRPVRDQKNGKPREVTTNKEVFSVVSTVQKRHLERLGHRFPLTFHVNGTGLGRCAHNYCCDCQKLIKVTPKGKVTGSAYSKPCNSH